MSTGGSLQLSHEFGLFKNYGMTNKFKSVEMKSRTHLLSVPFSSRASQQDAWSLYVSDMMYKPLCYDPYRHNIFMCQSLAVPSSGNEVPLLKSTTLALTRSFNAMCERPLVLQLVPAVGIIAFAIWGLGPIMCHSRNLFLHRNDRNWKKSRTYYVFTSYLQPLLLWTGSTLVCRVLDPVVLPSEASQAVKQRLLNFIRTLSTVLALAYCLSSLIQQIQKILLETKNPAATRNMGFNFAGKAVFTAVWIAAFSLFMELLGFSAQKWITAGSLGTVLLTIAGQEIFTNFLSSIIIHATRPFVVNEWIQTNVEGYDVSGTAEHVGWWTPTIIRGEDREAVHIPNHIFTVNVVRNLSQKTHWRIKTHLAISHLDVRKIHKIVGEMRKVLAKNPQVEQQRLHRRVFLEYINPENQALMILVSCFVKTSHFEEYLRVKEAILLDLLGVISHHRARLATPIRTVQRMYGDADVENVPFAETVITRAGAATARRPLLLIEPSSKIDGHDEAKALTPPGSNEEQTTKTIAAVAEPIVASVTEVTDSNSSDKQQEQEKKANSGDDLSKSTKAEGPDGMELGSKADSQKLPLSEGDDKAKVHDTHESEGLPAKPSPVTRPVWENNIVLGVALEGSKRTLPIEEGIDPVPTPREAREVAGCRNGSRAPSSAKDKKSRTSAAPGAAAAGLQDQVES